MANLIYEQELWSSGYEFVAGIDEVGRGCFAGPVCAGTVVFPRNSIFEFSISNEIPIINDSKKLNKKQREAADIWIKENSLAWGIGEASVATINKLGIKKATEVAFRKAVIQVNMRLRVGNVSSIENEGEETTHPVLDFVLIDAFYIPYIKGLRRSHQKAIIKGDNKSISIAAASIIAKVHRDSLMAKLSQNHKEYLWDINKGYGTKDHREAILKFGTTRHHRKDFVGTWLKKSVISKQ